MCTNSKIRRKPLQDSISKFSQYGDCVQGLEDQLCQILKKSEARLCIYIYTVYIYLKSRGPGFDSQRVSDFLFVPLRPFFYAAFAKRWKVQFRQG